MSTTPHRLRAKPEPYRPITYLEANAEAHPDRAAIIDGRREISFSELYESVRQLMGLLRARVKPGEVVAVALPNVATYVALEIATPAIGAVIMPLPPALGKHELRSALERSGAVLVITSEQSAVEEVGSAMPRVREVLTLQIDGVAGVSPHDQNAFDTGAEDIVQIALTSGTTGAPKLAAFKAELKQVTFEGFTSRLAITSEDRVLPISPITQGAGEMFLYSLRVGAALVMTHEARFSAEHALGLADSSRATVIGGVPTMLSRMLDCQKFDRADLSALRLTAVAGAPLSPELARTWEDRTGAPVVSFYGAMDIGQLAVPSPDDPQPKRWNTVGRPHDRAEWAVLDPAGRDVPPGEQGEICMRGPLVQNRYWDEETGPYGDDGWAHFGDIGFVDKDGYVHLTGRVKDTIIRGGNNINPHELEEIVRRHPAVQDVGIVGRPDPDLGERAVAFVVLSPESELDLEQLKGFLDQEGVARYKWPEDLQELSELPVGPTGKLLRAKLRERDKGDHGD